MNNITQARINARQARVDGYMAKTSLNYSEIAFITRLTIRQVREAVQSNGLAVSSKGQVLLSDLQASKIL